MAKQVKPKPVEAEEQVKEVINEVIEQVTEEQPKPIEVFNEAKSVDDIYGMLCELHTESETLQRKAALELGLIPTQLQVVTTQLNICKNNIARALGK